jgi:hypothetical protein
MKISLSDPRLSRPERRFLEAIATKLRDPHSTQPLPEGYKRALDEAFGSCGEGETDSVAAGGPRQPHDWPRFQIDPQPVGRLTQQSYG